jgi:hypothetical protein
MYLNYTSSFLNAANQNIEFRKTNLPAGKLNAASVRTDQVNVNGAGQIAELWFRIKPGTAENTAVNFSVINAYHVSANGTQVSITGGSAQTFVLEGPVGLIETGSDMNALVFPNPGTGLFTLYVKPAGEAKFRITDLSGRELASGNINNADQIDLSSFENGTYFVTVVAGEKRTTKKIVILH